MPNDTDVSSAPPRRRRRLRYVALIVLIVLSSPFAAWFAWSRVEAARLDGASEWQVFSRIVLPLIKPGLAAAAIFTFRIAWNELVLASVLSNRATRTLPYAVYLFITDVGIEWGKLMAAGVLVALPPLVFTFFAARQIIAGLTAGALKG